MIDYTRFIAQKIMDISTLKHFLYQWRFREQKIVFTNGCFDVLHRGHAEYLAQAASLGHRLIVGLNSDESVKKLKGKDRPLNDSDSRAKVLASLQMVDAVVVFNQETPWALIKEIEPDVLCKGGDYAIDTIVGREFAKETIILPFVNGYSTTAMIQKIKQ